jgi:hypothetical protein
MDNPRNKKNLQAQDSLHIYNKNSNNTKARNIKHCKNLFNMIVEPNIYHYSRHSN